MPTRTGWIVLHAILALLSLGIAPVGATPPGALVLTSDNSLGDVVWNTAGFLNTDTSAVYGYTNTGAEQFSYYVPSSIVVQADGSQVRVFDFHSLTVNAQMTLQGSLAAAIVSTGDIVVNAALFVRSAEGQGGAADTAAPGPMGGGAGAGSAVHVDPPCCGYTSAPGGGGGGKGSVGQQGVAGNTFPVGGANGTGGLGGGADPNTAILSGGGGGGGGGPFASDCCNRFPGALGGNGGGAAIFETQASFTIGSLGSVVANGSNGSNADTSQGAGGGGAGGMLWFQAATAWTNNGLVSATGGAGGAEVFNPPGLYHASYGGAGAGGEIFIDPPILVNNGLIDVSSGNGDNAFGGTISTFDQTFDGTGSTQGTVPEPATALLAAVWLVPLALRRRLRAA